MTRSRASAEPRPSDCHLRVRRRTTHERPHRSPFSNTGIARRAVLSSRLDPTLIVLRAFRVHSGLSCCTRLSGLLRCEVIRYSTRCRCPGVTRCERRSRATIVEPVPSTHYGLPCPTPIPVVGSGFDCPMEVFARSMPCGRGSSRPPVICSLTRVGGDDDRTNRVRRRAIRRDRISSRVERPGEPYSRSAGTVSACSTAALSASAVSL